MSLSFSLSLNDSVINARTTLQQQELRLSFGKWTAIVPGIIVAEEIFSDRHGAATLKSRF